MYEELKVEDIVEKVGPKTDYTVGRQGTIIEISSDKKRVRVYWTHDEGKPMHKPVRTWVTTKAVKLIPKI